jgi:predicted alpha/beta-hydrolase family hydrolase
VKAKPVYPRQVAAFLAAAILVVCLVDGSAHLAIADSSSAIKQTAAQNLDNRSDVQAKGGLRGVPLAPAITPTAAEPSSIASRARVYLFRGALGPIFSRGMDHLTEKIQRAGVRANVYEFTICSLIASAAIKDYREDPAPIILIGHSMGGSCALLFAEKLQNEGFPVSLVVTIDPARMSPDVPLNVEHFINIFLSKDVLGGGDIELKQGFRGSYASYDLAQHDEVSHITIDKMDAIHQQLIAKIVQLTAAPAKAEGEVIPLRYVVPASEEIELWDSGMAVTARSRDTLQTLALRYRLPQWSLTQINQMPDNAPLTAGERIIVPRHLAPLTTVSEPISSRP